MIEMAEYSIGIDIGGTKIATGIVSKNGEILHNHIYETPQSTSADILNLLKDVIYEYEQVAQREKKMIVGVGIGSAGQISFQQGKITSGTDNIKGWNNVPIREFLSKHTELPIRLDNDANVFAIAEHHLGHGKSIDNLVCLTVGTGVGGGVISGGKVLRGEWGGAGELGHITVDMNGPPCNCGSRGCIETYASGTGIANRMQEKMNSMNVDVDSNSQMIHFKNNPEQLTSKEVIQWYEQGIPEAVAVINDAIRALTYGIINLIHTFNPTKVIFGGGLIEHNPWLLEKIKTETSKRGMATLVQPVEMAISKLGYHAGLIGAAHLLWTADE